MKPDPKADREKHVGDNEELGAFGKVEPYTIEVDKMKEPVRVYKIDPKKGPAFRANCHSVSLGVGGAGVANNRILLIPPETADAIFNNPELYERVDLDKRRAGDVIVIYTTKDDPTAVTKEGKKLLFPAGTPYHSMRILEAPPRGCEEPGCNPPLSFAEEGELQSQPTAGDPLSNSDLVFPAWGTSVRRPSSSHRVETFTTPFHTQATWIRDDEDATRDPGLPTGSSRLSSGGQLVAARPTEWLTSAGGSFRKNESVYRVFVG